MLITFSSLLRDTRANQLGTHKRVRKYLHVTLAFPKRLWVCRQPTVGGCRPDRVPHLADGIQSGVEMAKSGRCIVLASEQGFCYCKRLLEESALKLQSIGIIDAICKTINSLQPYYYSLECFTQVSLRRTPISWLARLSNPTSLHRNSRRLLTFTWYNAMRCKYGLDLSVLRCGTSFHAERAMMHLRASSSKASRFR